MAEIPLACLNEHARRAKQVHAVFVKPRLKDVQLSRAAGSICPTALSVPAQIFRPNRSARVRSAAVSLSKSESGPSGIPFSEKPGTPVAEEKPPDDTHSTLANLRELAFDGLSGLRAAQTKVSRGRDTKIFGIVEPGIVNTESETG